MLFSRQPKLRHIFSPRAATAETVVCRPPGPGRGTVVQYLPALHAWELNIGTLNYIDYLPHCVPVHISVLVTMYVTGPVEGVPLLLGYWWLEAAERGGPDLLPLVPASPRLGLIQQDGTVLWDNEVWNLISLTVR